MFLFESTAELAKKLLQEQHAVTVPAYKRKIVLHKTGIREEMLSVLPKEYEEYVIDDEEVCSVCGSAFCMGKGHMQISPHMTLITCSLR